MSNIKNDYGIVKTAWKTIGNIICNTPLIMASSISFVKNVAGVLEKLSVSTSANPKISGALRAYAGGWKEVAEANEVNMAAKEAARPDRKLGGNTLCFDQG